MNAAIENMLTRASVRQFQDKQVSKEELEIVVKAGLHAPTAMNAQSFQITVVQNPDVIKRLYEAIPKYMDIKQPYNFYGAKTFVILSDRADREIGQMDCACVAENMLLAAHSVGLGACWINQLRNTGDCPEVRAILTEIGVPADHKTWLSIAIGHPAVKPEPKERTAKVVYVD